MRLVPAFLAATLTLAAAAQTPTKHPMTFEDLQAMKRVADPQISPSGKWVLFSVMDVDLARNAKVNHLWLVPADGSAKERQLTFGDGESNGRFSPDGSRIVYVSNGQLYLAAWNEAGPDAAGSLSRAVQLTHIVTEADAPLWSPDGQSLAFVSELYPECSTGYLFDENCNQKATDDTAKAPTKALIFDSLLYRHWNLYQGAKRSHILMLHLARPGYLYDLTPTADWGRNIIAPTFSLGGSSGYAWAPDSKEFAFVLNADKVPAASTNNDIYTIDVTQHDAEPANKPGAPHLDSEMWDSTNSKQGHLSATGWSPKKISTSPGSDDAPAYSPDGKYLAFRSQARAGYESDRFRLMLYDREAKTTKEVQPDITQRNDAQIDEFSWEPSSAGIFYTYGYQGQENVDFIGVKGNTLGFLQGEGEFSDVRLMPSGEKGPILLVASRMTAERPSEIVTLPTEHPRGTSEWGGETAITHLNDSLLAQLDQSKMESFWFPGAGGTKVQGFLIRPPNFDPAKKYPLKFLIHGGPQGAWGDAWSYRWNAELMAASGYVVVMINPRGSVGYGQSFVDGVNGDWGGKPYIDLMRGLDYAESHFAFIDKARECALGASYGGYMANWILTHTSRFACIVTHDGMFNPQSAYGTTEELWFNEWEFRRPGSQEPGQPWRYASGPVDADPFRRWSPMLSIQNAKTPTLVIHSQRDYRLDVSEGFQLFTALQRLGVPSKMLYFPDEGHWVLKPQNSKLWYETVGDWCDKYTHTNKYAEAAK
jgi:dipeptidyl aminopeptidase/acylaminoacyl peptidase